MMKKIAKLSSLLFVSKNFLCTNPDQYQYPFVETLQFSANNPIEDRISFAKLNSINAFALSVFDGHGGDLVVIYLLKKADFASYNLNTFLEKRLQQNLKQSIPLEEILTLSLN